MSEADEWHALERFAFGDTAALAGALVALVLAGTKTATCWSVAAGPPPPPRIGQHMVALDGAGSPRAILETIAVEQRRFDAVEPDFAFAEGEGDRSPTTWRVGHQGYFRRNGDFAPAMLLWCERFRLVRRL